MNTLEDKTRELVELRKKNTESDSLTPQEAIQQCKDTAEDKPGVMSLFNFSIPEPKLGG